MSEHHLVKRDVKHLGNQIIESMVALIKECHYNKSKETNRSSPHCPIVFDGYSCWNATPEGETAFLPCPSFVIGFDPKRFAHKTCLKGGSWYRHPLTNLEWSNYTTCVDVEDLGFRQFVNKVYIAGYSLSVLTLILSLAIFLSFRSLRCTRIYIHIQLFASFTVNNVLWIVWYQLVVENIVVVRDNTIWCQGLHVILHFFMVSNYMWMFCEGLHLHIALVVVFATEKVVMRWFHAVGWLLPFVLTLCYATVRSNVEDTSRCWMNDTHSMWILTAPVCLSLIASLVFLVNVVRVLITKLHQDSVPVGMRKAVRATLILVPLFGIQHILLPFRPDPGAKGEDAYQIISAVIISLQGFCVSCLFCFANVDVHCAVKRMLSVLGANKDTIMVTVMQDNTQSHSREVAV